MAATLTPFTADDYRRLPEGGPRFQLIEGEFYMAPAPNRYHQDVSRNIEFLLLKYLEKHPIGRVYHAPFDVYLSENDVLQPDIVYVSNANSGILTEEGARGAPDLVIEILSPSNAYLDRGVKRGVYARAGVKELWLVDPATQNVDVFELARDANKPVVIFNAAGNYSSALLPGLSFTGREIFKR